MSVTDEDRAMTDRVVALTHAAEAAGFRRGIGTAMAMLSSRAQVLHERHHFTASGELDEMESQLRALLPEDRT